MIAIPVAQERNIVYRSGKSKKYEDNLYYALKSDDMDFDIEQNNDEYKYQKRYGPREKKKASYIEMQSFKKWTVYYFLFIEDWTVIKSHQNTFSNLRLARWWALLSLDIRRSIKSPCCCLARGPRAAGFSFDGPSSNRHPWTTCDLWHHPPLPSCSPAAWIDLVLKSSISVSEHW